MKLHQTVTHILRKASLSQNTIEKHFVTPSSLHLFQQSLTSKDYDASINYETVESRGDAMVNMIATTYTLNRFPKVKSLKWKAKLQHNLFGTKSLSTVSDILGLTPLIRHRGELYSQIKEDVVEAFLGVIGTICKENISAYYSISYLILSWCYDQFPFINLNHSEQFDPLSRLKELHDAYQMVFVKGKSRVLPGGDYEKSFTLPLKPPLTVTSKGATEQLAERRASLEALKVLGEKGYQEKIPNPFEIYLRPKKEAIELPSLPKLPSSFEEKVLNYFSKSSEKIREVVRLNLNELFKCFFDSRYYIGVNAADEKFIGVSVVDLIAVEYIFTFEKNLSPKIIMTLKHSIANGELYVVAFGELVEFVQLPIELSPEEHANIIKSCFKAFVGASFDFFNREFGNGAGLAIWKEILFCFIKLNPPSVGFIQPMVLLNKKFPGEVKVVDKQIDKEINGVIQKWWTITVYVKGKKTSEATGAGKKIVTNRAAEESVKKLNLR